MVSSLERARDNARDGSNARDRSNSWDRSRDPRIQVCAT